MGTDTIVVGDGQNVIYGDIRDSFFSTVGGHSSMAENSTVAFVQSLFNFMGSETISAGDGGNEIYGDARDMTFLAEGSVNTSVGGSPGAIDVLLLYFMGSDIITSGDGNDQIYGDIRNVLIDSQAGQSTTPVIGTPSVIAAVFFYMGDESGAAAIHAGGGDDLIAGDAYDFTVLSKAGHTLDEFTSAVSEVAAIIMVGGQDEIYGEAGHDKIYGDLHALTMITQGGTATGAGGIAESGLINTSITLGNDELDGGQGNDLLYGDLESASFSAIAGTDLSGGLGHVDGYFSGDIVIPFRNINELDEGSTIVFGDDILIGGDGADFLSGDAVHLSGLADFLEVRPTVNNVHNQIIWGDDELTGGSGLDTFSFTLVDASIDNVITNANSDGVNDALQGDDTITDLEAGDTLQFLDVEDVNGGSVDLSDLNDMTTFTDVNLGADLEISFDGGGSLTINGYGNMGIGDFNALVALGVAVDVSG